jgi:hypothetical protein
MFSSTHSLTSALDGSEWAKGLIHIDDDDNGKR